jgi:hypothetical protein
MATSKKSIGKKSKNQTSSVGATPVSLLVRLANGEEKKIRDTCGHGLEKPLASYDPSTQSWKMYGDISLWGDCPLLLNLPPSGMTLNGVLFLQLPWEPIIGETALSSWPTPRVTGSGENIESIQKRFKNGLKYKQRLEEAVALWPYPTMSANGMGNTGSRQMLDKKIADGSITEEEKRAMTAGNGGKLNPTWVEWLMGFPAGWTDLED